MIDSSLTEYLVPLWARQTDLVIDHAKGCYLYTPAGTKILDFTSGYGVTNTGHCHPKVVKAIQDQAEKLLHGQLNLFYHPTVLQLAKKLHDTLPTHLDRYFFATSGAEAVESAVKMARQSTKKTNIIVFQNAFHGRTALTMSLTTSKVRHRQNYQPLIPGVFIAPYPYSYFFGWDEEETSAWCLRQLKHMLHTQTAPEETAAILVEPILGDGGYVPSTASFLQGLRKLCDDNEILFILDEIQSGWGRTGKLFAHEYANIEADILIMAKGLASGLPISAVAVPNEIVQNCLPGSQGGTLNGNAITCAAALATIDVIIQEELPQKAARHGKQIMDQLREIQRRVGFNGEVRGLGLMIALELSDSAGSPDAETAAYIRDECLKLNMLLATCGPYNNVLRWAPPLTISEDEIQQGIQIFKEVIKKKWG